MGRTRGGLAPLSPPFSPACVLQDGDKAACPSEGRRSPRPPFAWKPAAPPPDLGPRDLPVPSGVGWGVPSGAVLSPVILWRTSPPGPLPQRLRTLPAGLLQGKHGVYVGGGQPQGFGATCGLGQLLSPQHHDCGL